VQANCSSRRLARPIKASRPLVHKCVWRSHSPPLFSPCRYISHTTVEVSGCAFTDNINERAAEFGGGAVYIDSGSFKSYGTYFSGNAADPDTPDVPSDDSDDLRNLNGYILFTNNCPAGQTGIQGSALVVEGDVNDGAKVSYGDASGNGCTYCVAGKYNAIPFAFDCISCVAGTYRTAVGGIAQDDCTDCAVGKYVRERGSAPGIEPPLALHRFASLITLSLCSHRPPSPCSHMCVGSFTHAPPPPPAGTRRRPASRRTLRALSAARASTSVLRARPASITAPTARLGRT